MQNQNILSKKSNTIKCIISNKSKFYPGKSIPQRFAELSENWEHL